MSTKMCHLSDSGSVKFLENEFITTDEAAEYLRLSKQSLLNMTSNGKVPFYKLGNRNRYRLQDLQELLLKTKRGGFHGY